MVVFTNEINTPEANETKISEWRKCLNPRMEWFESKDGSGYENNDVWEASP